MSDFSDKLQIYMDRLGLSAYRLSKLSELERTGIYRIITGQRLPSNRFMLTILPYLKLNHSEEKELWNLLTIERIGKERYEEQQQVYQIFQETYRYLEAYSSDTDHFIFQTASSLFSTEKQSINLSSKHEIHSCLNFLLKNLSLSCKSTDLCFNFSENASLLAHLLLKLDQNSQIHLHVRQYVEIGRGAPYQNNDMKILQRILPLALSFHGIYEVFYAYSGQTEEDPSLRLFPYFLIVNNYTLLISSDWNAGLLIHSENVANTYLAELRRLHNQYTPLINKRVFDLDAAEYYCYSVQKENAPQYIYESWPCIMQVIGEVVNQSDAPEVAPFRKVAQQLLENYHTMNRSMTHYFGMEGMENFVRTGLLPGYMGILAGKIPQKMRWGILKQIFGNSEDSGTNRLLNQNLFPIIPGLFVEIYGKEKICIGHQDPNFPFIILCVTEPHICSAFYDFFQSMKESKFLYSEEETSQYLTDFLNRSQQILENGEELS